ncbi:MAG: phenylalanine--tRNA ligase subunit beta, partial [Acidimicrobiia bacterium]
MKVTLDWLRDFVDLPSDDPGEIAEVFTNLGMEVESVEHLESPLAGVIVARVAGIRPHPDADRIRLVRVATGDEEVEVVCGAWNFETDAVVPYATVGAVLAGGLEVKEREIRGVASPGMICSEAELGLGDDSAGILVLDDSAPIGADFRTTLPFPDVVFDLSITPNRPDCMSVHGLARELAAYYDLSVRAPSPKVEEQAPDSKARIIVDDSDGCPRFVAREVREVSIALSPLWMKLRLRAAGVRPINNVVDITNYVMLETGQPIHAFDLDRISEETLVVRRARDGERLTTLDGADRELRPDDLVIADPSAPVSLAGVMGGGDSEVGEETRRVLIECAHWDPPSILFTAKHHGLRTEASARFERGVDPNLPPVAAARAAELVVRLAGGAAATGTHDVYPRPIEPKVVPLPVSEVARILGIELDGETVAGLLGRLGFGVSGQDPLEVTVPTYRPDVSRPADLVEEVARLYGYDRIPDSVPTGPGGGLPFEERRKRTISRMMVGAGYHEALTFSFVGEDDVEPFAFPEGDPRHDGVRVRNPLREEEAILRTTLLPGLLKGLHNNAARRIPDVALFEIGKVFLRGGGTLPEQPDRLAFVAMGSAWGTDSGGEVRPVDVQRAVGTWETLARAMHLGRWELREGAAPGFHPGRCAEV